MPRLHKIVRSPRAAQRVAAAGAWLDTIAAGTEALIVAANWEAADDLLRDAANRRGAIFGIHRLTLDRLAGLLAADHLAEINVVPATGLAVEAVAARAVYRVAEAGRLGYFAPVAERPGFPGALARTLSELRLNRVDAHQIVRLDGAGEPLAALLTQFEKELEEARLIDRAGVLAIAREAATGDPPPRFAAMPTLLLDVPIYSIAERDFVQALAARAPSMLATVPVGDVRCERLLEAALGVHAETLLQVSSAEASSLVRLQDHLFAESMPPPRDLDGSVTILSAPGESRECVEIAREIHKRARAGVPFDRLAVLLRAPVPYNAHLEEALARAGVPVYFAWGTLRPEPGGRGLLTLLRCAAERLSAHCFAEYLSLAQVPDPDRDANAPFVPAENQLAATPATDPIVPAANGDAPAFENPVPVVEGTLRAPWRWEKLIVEASVIGGRGRWRRRLDGLQEEFRTKLAAADDDTIATYLNRQLTDLGHLKLVAMPIIDALDNLPRQASWREWLDALKALTNLAIRDREPVLTALGELEPMAPVGPIGLDEVRLVLAERLGSLTRQPPRRRYGSVYVGSAADARGLAFEVVFIPAIAERLFPQKLTEDPILSDRARKSLGADLIVQEDRRINERLALKLSVGAAQGAVMLSYPRIDIDQGRARVPSFYSLEAARAAEGRLRGFEELGRIAAKVRELRLGWPAPVNSADAIDNAEFDLALLDPLIDQEADLTIGTANYLLTSQHANPHLARSLRARARRWLRRWTPNDGLVDPDAHAQAALLRHGLAARSFSPTALQKFSECPYRFLLYTILKLEPREEPEPIETIDPLVRGSMFHEVVYEVLSALRERGALPVTAGNIEAALEVVAEKLGHVEEKFREKLAPAIDRVWQDGIASISADLSEWLRRAAERHDGWLADRFELSFGLRDRSQADPKSSNDPVAIGGGLKLRGSIDLVERDAERGRLRITDHKTGKVRADRDVVVGGGRVLQPLLYALAAEKLLAQRVDSGRLYYCTLAGGFEEREVELNEATRTSIAQVIDTIADSIQTGFLPAAPDDRECAWCDYRMLCGPYEGRRWKMKPRARLEKLQNLRRMA